jgi:predicted metal-dependent hydrolase
MTENNEINIDKIVRTDRKTLALVMSGDGRLSVRAPHKATLQEITLFVQNHKKWILKKRIEIKDKNKNYKPRKFEDGEICLFLGKPFNIKTDNKQEFALRKVGDDFFLNEKALPYAEKVFGIWYKQRAIEIIPVRAHKISKEMGLKYNRLGITSAKGRWGSCNSRKNINFSWRLMMAAPKVIDYVIIHELAHLKEMNHSAAFWKIVQQFMPDYKECRKWLKDNHQYLNM